MKDGTTGVPGAGGEPTVVVGVDAVGDDAGALLWAAAEAKRRRAALDVVHAYDRPHHGESVGLRSEAEGVVTKARGVVHTIYRDLTVHALAIEGSPGRALVNHGAHAALLVVGARSGRPAGAFLGSVSHHCVGHARCPVVVVRPSATHCGSGRRVVVGVDGSAGALDALRWALDEAALRGGTVEVVHAWQYPPMGAYGSTAAGTEPARAAAAAAAAEAARHAPDVPIQTAVPFGPTTQMLVDAAEGADLLVVGARGRRGLRRVVIGSTAQGCAELAHCPVVVVRGAGEHEPLSQPAGADEERAGTTVPSAWAVHG